MMALNYGNFVGLKFSYIVYELERSDASTKAPSWPVGVDGVHPPTKIPIPVPPSPSAKGNEPQRRPLQLSKQGQVLEIAIETAANVILDLKNSLNDWDSKVGDGDCGSTVSPVLKIVYYSC
ncbi:hypothetical protein Ahy_B05g075609 isoform E [Arachis hypogaea]|uniref:DhaL domain-containing protein n=1 Tax=Arachis hypogaea TaxID=3818 RepID=A0A444Z1J5_ARAHY|nr:hypothetical protein Ahy_B05g075609 isoform E [Arachis hypogaea]